MKYSLYRFKHNKPELVKTANSMEQVSREHDLLIDQVRKEFNLDWNAGYFLQTKSGESYMWKNTKGDEVKI